MLFEMDSVDLMSASNSNTTSDSNNVGNPEIENKPKKDNYLELQEVIANLQKPNVPNVNIPERIIICLDVCYDDENSLFRFGDGTTFTKINMMKRVLDFFVYSKHAINKETQFALVILKDCEACWLQNFTSNITDIIIAIDYIHAEESISETFDFNMIFELLAESVEMPGCKQGENILPQPYAIRMILLYGRSNCIPIIPQGDSYLNYLKRHMYFYIDILLIHEDDCALYRCEEVFDALQDLDNGYSYVFEVSRNATKIHDCIAKLLAHPLQRPLQKDTDYTFGK